MSDPTSGSKEGVPRRIYVAESNTVRTYPHAHTSLALTYVVHGNAEHVINGEETHLSDGDFFLIDLGSWHSCRVLSQDIRLISIIFTAGIFGNNLAETMGVSALLSSGAFSFPAEVGNWKIADRVFHDPDLEINKLFSGALQECQKGAIGWKNMVRSYIAEILVGMVRRARLPEIGAQGTDIIFHCKTYIKEHYPENLTLAEICKKLGYSVPYVSSKFRETTGMTFSQYLQRERVNRSRALLLCTNLSIDDICEKVGYHNSTFFYRIFKNNTGVSPKEYRSSHENLPKME